MFDTRRTRVVATSLTLTFAAVGVLGAPSLVVSAATNSNSVHVLTCAAKSVVKPSSFVITCADANTLLTKTHWSSWTSKSAEGTTTFGINLCTPYCAASPITYCPNATVHLSQPESTKYGRIFSRVVVRYKAKGKSKVFQFSWAYLSPTPSLS